MKKCQKKFDFFEIFFDDIFESRKFSKRALFFSITFFSYIENFRKFWIFNFFRKYFSHRKKMFFGNFFIFYVFIISHALPTQVVSRKSPCAAHKRGKRIPEYRENQENYSTRPSRLSYLSQTVCLIPVPSFGDFLDFPDIRGCVCRACGRHKETCAIPLAWVGHEI